ncbi:MAG TPA: hypothetical protein VNC61_09685 [Acidimicrobiales bacterium]|nr:hypothetical protein [Acidimicrobiales bacterium]
MKRTGLLVLGSLGLLGTACSGGVSNGDLSGQTAPEVLATSLAAAQTSGSVHFELLGKRAGKAETIVGDASGSSGREIITVGALKIQAEVTGGQAFIEGNVGGLEGQIGLSAADAKTYAGKWISIASTDAPYASVTKAVTLASTLTQIKPNGHLILTAATTKAGQAVIGVKGGLPGPASKGTTGSATLYVSTTRPTVPIVFAAEQTSSGVKETDVGTFSRWGTPIKLAVPTATVAFSSLPGNPATTPTTTPTTAPQG